MLGDGIVSFGRAPDTFSRRNSKSGPKIVCVNDSFSSMWAEGGAQSYSRSLLWKWTRIVSSWTLLTPAELVDEVHVPGLAAELAVGRGLEADLLLASDDVADRLVLQPAQLGVVDAAGGVVVAGLQSSFGRSRLPTWSARNGGSVRMTRVLPAVTG
jgi:hypothetical protein